MASPAAPRPATAQAALFSKAAFPAVLFFSALVRLINLGRQSLWYDETYTAYVSGLPFDRMMQFLLADGVHPPLYYWLMAGWIRLFGDLPVSLRLPSAIGGTLAVLMVYLLVRRMTGEPEALLAAILLGISPFLLWYSQDARMYSLLGLAAITAVYFFWNFLEKPAILSALGLVLSHAVLYGLHYFGVFLLFSEVLFLILFWRKYLRLSILFLVCQSAAMAPLVVWGSLLLKRENGSFGIGWIPKPVWTDPIQTILNFFTADAGHWGLPAVFVGVVLVLLTGLALRNRRRKEPVALGIFWLVIPILVAWFLSERIPIYIDRYLIGSLPGLVLLVSIGAFSIPGRKQFLLPALLILGMLPGLAGVVTPAEGFRKEDWRDAAQSIRSRFQSGDVILLRVFQVAIPLNYYGLLDLRWDPIETNRVVEFPDLSDVTGTCYLVYWLPAQSAHSFGTVNPKSFAEADPKVQAWLDRSFRIIAVENSYHGILIVILEPIKGK
jgi:mannosyltransferase